MGDPLPLARQPLLPPKALFVLAVLLGLCAVAALINPFGLDLPRTWLHVLFGMDLSTYIMEHARLDPGRLVGRLVLLTGLAYLIFLVGTWPTRPRITWLLPLVWLALSCSRIRHSPLFAIAAVLALADLLPFCRWRVFAPQAAANRLGWRPLVLPAFMVGLALTLQATATPFPVLGAGSGKLDPAVWPTDLVPALRSLQASCPAGEPIYSDFYDGSFLMYHAPGLRIFNDDRCELYGDRWQIEQIHVIYDRPEAIDELARTEGFRLALVRNGVPLRAYLDAARNWEVIERGRIAVLYRRREE